jgi:hypothetical protein
MKKKCRFSSRKPDFPSRLRRLKIYDGQTVTGICSSPSHSVSPVCSTPQLLQLTHVSSTAVFMKLWSTDHRWSTAVRQVRGGFEKKIAKIVIRQLTNEKITFVHICAKTAFVSSTTGNIFLQFTCMHFFGCEKFYERWVVHVFADRL